MLARLVDTPKKAPCPILRYGCNRHLFHTAPSPPRHVTAHSSHTRLTVFSYIPGAAMCPAGPGIRASESGPYASAKSPGFEPRPGTRPLHPSQTARLEAQDSESVTRRSFGFKLRTRTRTRTSRVGCTETRNSPPTHRAESLPCDGQRTSESTRLTCVRTRTIESDSDIRGPSELHRGPELELERHSGWRAAGPRRETAAGSRFLLVLPVLDSSSDPSLSS